MRRDIGLKVCLLRRSLHARERGTSKTSGRTSKGCEVGSICGREVELDSGAGRC